MKPRNLIGIFVLLTLFTAVSHRCAAEDCPAPDVWFTANGTPPVPPNFQVPDEMDECGFYQWAWQSFLWLTQSQNGSDPRFIDVLKTENDLFSGPGMTSKQIVATPRQPATNSKKMLALSMRTLTVKAGSTTSDVSTTAFEQATSRGVVVDRNGRALYYGIHINDMFISFVRNDLGLKSADQIVNVSKIATFPPGCLELKSAWRVLSDEEKLPVNRQQLEKRFFITDAVVPTLFLDAATNKIKADLAHPRPETVALLALHVVGTIVNHHEFIWASFEHIDNSPVLNGTAPDPMSPVDSMKDYSLYRKGTLGRNCNLNPIFPYKLAFANVDKQTLTPVGDIYRLNNSGDNGVGEDDKVKSLNDNVHAKLPPNLSLWKNYALIGATWLKANTLAPGTSDFAMNLQGELRLSNSTMETFTQPSKVNCFGCHNTSQEMQDGKTLPGLQIKISHVIRNAYLPNH